MPFLDGDERTQSIVAVGAVVVAFLAFGYAGYRFFLPPPTAQSIPHEPMAYFYDLNTGDLFTAPASEQGPLETKSGSYHGHPAGVRAHVYACESCDDPARRFVAWVEIPIETLVASDPRKYQKYLERDNAQGEVATTMVRRPKEEEWVRADSADALKIFEESIARCDAGEGVYRCRPPARPIN